MTFHQIIQFIYRVLWTAQQTVHWILFIRSLELNNRITVTALKLLFSSANLFASGGRKMCNLYISIIFHLKYEHEISEVANYGLQNSYDDHFNSNQQDKTGILSPHPTNLKWKCKYHFVSCSTEWKPAPDTIVSMFVHLSAVLLNRLRSNTKFITRIASAPIRSSSFSKWIHNTTLGNISIHLQFNTCLLSHRRNPRN